MSNLGRLSGKIAVVTGAASGIGKAVCSRFLQEGARIMLVDKNENLLSETQAELNEKYPSQSIIMCGDVQKESLAQDVFNNTTKHFQGPCTVLINAAGIGMISSIKKMELADFNRVIGINLNGVFIFTKFFLAALNDCSNDYTALKPSIVNVSSIAGKLGMDYNAAYAASKSGVIGFTKSTCLESGKHGIRCNAVLPSFIETPLLDDFSSKYLHASTLLNPMKRLGQPHEVANACLFLASDESSYVNGTTLEVSGGLGA